MDRLDVFLDERLIGTLERTPQGAQFQVTAPLDHDPALHLPKEGRTAQGLANLPPYFANLLPEGVMLAAVLRKGKVARDDLFGILAETGDEAIGDITARPPGQEPAPPISLEEADYSGLVEMGRIAAISGVQPKASLSDITAASRLRSKTASYIVKAALPDYPHLVENELFFMTAAQASGIRTAKVATRENCLVVTRFDRVWSKEEKRLRQIHMEDGLMLLDAYPNAKYTHEFTDILTVAQQLGGAALISEMLELYIFSWLIGNGDLHEKNIALLYDHESGTWRRSPAYDLVSTLFYKDVLREAERMAIALDDEAFGRFNGSEFVEMGERFGVPAKATRRTCERLADAVPTWLPGLDDLPYSQQEISDVRSEIERRRDDLMKL